MRRTFFAHQTVLLYWITAVILSIILSTTFPKNTSQLPNYRKCAGLLRPIQWPPNNFSPLVKCFQCIKNLFCHSRTYTSTATNPLDFVPVERSIPEPSTIFWIISWRLLLFISLIHRNNSKPSRYRHQLPSTRWELTDHSIFQVDKIPFLNKLNSFLILGR